MHIKHPSGVPLPAHQAILSQQSAVLRELFCTLRAPVGSKRKGADEQAAPRRVPLGIQEVDNGAILGFSAELSEDHPGFHDAAYKQRRVNICNLARSHRIGEPIPHISYTAEEVAVWGSALTRLEHLFQQHACKEFQRSWPLFDLRPDAVPQLEDLSQVLQGTTGFRIRPVAGLLHPRDFLNGLAFRTFHSTQYMRHSSKPDYTPEPDVIHEVIGHLPMLADPSFASLAHAIGVASLAADEEQLKHLVKLYWYTVEFGVVREGSDVKAFGAGILSSYGELQHMAAGGAEVAPLDVWQPLPKISYKDGYQKRYFALESFEAGAVELQAYCASLQAGLTDEVRRCGARQLRASPGL
ncbi:chloroplast phenylalanine hydroxylase [Micractinium conductrix]|uniref:phenylalanine 4-monooxygenase n=1 Tax=Micractinium conductrix TaxID=554055 RepID=A0A2P6VBN6_9CHLO|nr:chloroplast phenylalanine hydroxylase [Micractinium conductrix]|eukprot:PSC71499.1 chloroplast phenylalanine hydroxylase [Micractinium conductrix]